MKILAVDFGDKRTGLAVSDDSGKFAFGVGTVTADGKNKLAQKISDIAHEKGCSLIVVGNPINMNGTRGPRSERACAFAGLLSEVSGIETRMFDERCTTVAASSYLNATNTRGSDRKAVIDTLSAEIILQNYLDLNSN